MTYMVSRGVYDTRNLMGLGLIKEIDIENLFLCLWLPHMQALLIIGDISSLKLI